MIPRRPSPTSACMRNARESTYLSRYIGWDAGTRTFVNIDDSPRPDNGELEASEIGTQVHQILAGVHVEAPAAESVELADRFLH